LGGDLRVMTIFGTRPEAIKMAPVVRALCSCPGMRVTVIVTAQHRELLDQVLRHFDIVPDVDLNIMRQAQTLADITCRALRGLGRVFEERRPDLVLVHGDTTTTVAAALAAFYARLAVGHVEAGLRTNDKYAPYPEEMNRRLTGRLSDLHFAPTPWAAGNLLAEGVPEERVFVTGNTVIDALLQTARADHRFEDPALDRLAAGPDPLIVVDAHRRENLGPAMERICQGLLTIVDGHPTVRVVVSVHPNPGVVRAVRSLLAGRERIRLMDPLPYVDWVNLMRRACLILTDSGGIQEEAPALDTPVLLLRDVTERPEAIAAGTVRLVGTQAEAISAAALELLTDRRAYAAMATAANPYGDGRAAERIVGFIRHHFQPERPRPEPFRPPMAGEGRPM